MSAPEPQHPGERLASYFSAFFSTIVGISTLGASISFSKVVQTPVKPWVDYGVAAETIQNHLSVAFVLFLIDLALTSTAASALSLYRPQAVSYFGRRDSHQRRVVMWWATLVSVVLFGLLFAAFVFLGLVVAAYAGPIGWVAVGFLCLFGLTILGVIVWQSPIGSPSPEEVLRRQRERDMLDQDGSPSHVSSPEKSPVRRPAYPPGPGYDDVDDGGEPGPLGHYKDDAISATPRVPADPIPGYDPLVPPYMADLRRLRSLRAEKEERSQARRDSWRDSGRPGSDVYTYTYATRH
ncbi:uncharacterized protein THITE_2115477 [Thermothielavioides terrestris NRRL 8126]|uniref:Uncharacterized protein n=1 Tax=Thermothielavioides terrestris (strain ATCC 38088 / NRRL 8126) TaxID=578455 RepID=G2R4H5_THETT|nr:uncharacterized protein THITE_2115477 [Thermothielavioides terrestris NRRL 8126]AEO66919.1 hypothetical protein THITE_2115477 [Thermothielavioides terrestris NRRL 8126]